MSDDELLEVGTEVIATLPHFDKNIPQVSIRGTITYVYPAGVGYFQYEVRNNNADGPAELRTISFRANEVKRADPSDHE